jgi:hypothetical protein
VSSMKSYVILFCLGTTLASVLTSPLTSVPLCLPFNHPPSLQACSSQNAKRYVLQSGVFWAAAPKSKYLLRRVLTWLWRWTTGMPLLSSLWAPLPSAPCDPPRHVHQSQAAQSPNPTRSSCSSRPQAEKLCFSGLTRSGDSHFFRLLLKVTGA